MAVHINVRSNLREAVARTRAQFSTQLQFAAARALTQTAADVRAEVPAELERVLDRPTPFTKNGLFIQAARKGELIARVGFKDRQAAYMAFQIAGGTRRPNRKALKLPATIRLDEHGNIPRAAIAKLIAAAQAGKRLGKATRRKVGISKSADIFYGTPENNDGRPAGIYQRIVTAAGGHRLIPLVVFPQQSAKYRPRFDFAGLARRVFERKFQANFAAAFRAAVASAR